MRKSFLTALLISFLFARADSFDVTNDGFTVVVREDRTPDRLFVYNVLLDHKKEISILPRSSAWVKIIRDSLVMVQYTFGSAKTLLYSLQTGNQVFSSPENCFPDGNENYLYYLGLDWQLMRYDLNDYKSYPTDVALQKPKGYEWPSVFKISRDNARMALVVNNKKKSTIAVYDMASGKLVNDFDDFEYYTAFNTNSLYKDALVFFDLNKDGTQLVAGNEKWARLYDVNKGKKIATFEENPTSHREGFGNATFSNDGKTVYLQSRYRLYFMKTADFTPASNIIVGGKEEVYGSKSYLSANFTWHNLALTKDNRYLVTICNPTPHGPMADKQPFMMRKDISIPDPNKPVTFLYK